MTKTKAEHAQEPEEDSECGDVKRGGIDVACTKMAGHVEAGDYWHSGKVTVADIRTIESNGVSRHVVTTTTTELVEWMDPVRHLEKVLREKIVRNRKEAEKDA